MGLSAKLHDKATPVTNMDLATFGLPIPASASWPRLTAFVEFVAVPPNKAFCYSK